MRNGKYLIGFIGFGGIAQVHLAGWRKLPDAEVYAVADPSEAARKKAQEEGIPVVAADSGRVLAVEEIDIVDICAPNACHCPAAVAALRAGKHVLCEKPLAISSAEVRRMIEEARTAKRKLMAAQHQRFRPDSRAVKRMIDEGLFGEIYFAQALALRRRLLPARPGFISKKLAGGGPLFDIGVHILDLTWWFMGCPPAVSASATVLTKLAHRTDIRGLWGEWDRKAYDVEDFAAGFIRLSDGRAISLACSFLANMEKQEEFSATLFGTEAGMKFPDGKIATEKHGVLLDMEPGFRHLPQAQPHHEEIREFLACVKDDAPVPVPPEESRAVIGMLEGMYRSARTGTEVSIARLDRKAEIVYKGRRKRKAHRAPRERR